MRVWITGIAGMIGSHLADALIKRGDVVGGNDNLICGSRENVPAKAYFKQIGCQENPIAVWRNDLFGELKKFKPDVVVHCAATASEGFSVFSPYFITRNIAEASVITFSAAIAAGAKRIVHMSSMSRYGKGNPPFKEDDAVNPVDPYAQAKVYSEQVLQALCKEHNVKWTIAVPHNVIGPRQEITPYRNVATIFLNLIRQNKPIYIYGDGEQKRCFSPIKDCLPSLVKMVDGVADGQIINIGPDNSAITVNELARMCGNIAGKKVKKVYLPPRPLTDDVKEAHCSSDKARKILGFKERQSLYECLVEMNAAMNPRPFKYGFPIEIKTERTPRTWTERLM